jgi:hypothetical protein
MAGARRSSRIVTVTAEKTGVRLETGCVGRVCDDFSTRLYEQMSGGKFDEMAAMPLLDVGEWEGRHRTARKRANRCEAKGYVVDVVRREKHIDDIHEVNTSADRRQGRPMSDSYRKRYEYGPLPTYPCERHQVRTYGVISPWGRLVAYLWLYVAGQLRLCSSIIGHAEHLDNGVMYLMFRGMVEREHDRDPDGVVMYHRWDNGTDGLRFYKERVGLRETMVEWLP